MLKYTHGGIEPGPTGNMERLFVHRIHDSGHHVHDNEATFGPYHNFDMNPPSTPTTFWKSPYAGDNSIFRNSVPTAKNICMRPEVNVSPSKLTSKFPSNEPKPVSVKGILKNKLTHFEIDKGITMEDMTPISGEEKMHLITTGTGKGRPHMPILRSTSAEKRVQFNGIPNGTSQEAKSMEKYSGKGANSKLPAGRRLYYSNTTRILGTRKAVHPPTCGRFYGSVAVSSIGGGESHIKNQINDFVKRLRLAESEKLAKAERTRSAKVENDTRKGSAEGVRRSRCKTSMNRFHDWEEFDIDKPKSAKSDEDIVDTIGKKESKVIYNVYHSKDSDVAVNNDDSVSSVDSVKTRSLSGEETAVRTQSAVKIIRPKPMVSLYTKYSHITTNYLNLNKYGTKARSPQSRSRSCKSTSTQKPGTNFCDQNKTSQILGWLEEVKNAQTVDDTQVTSETKQPVPNKKS